MTWIPAKGTVLDTVDSTNDWLKKQQPQPGSWVVAKSQSGGRGRGDNIWRSPLGNLYLSVCVPRLNPLTLVSLATGVAVADFCRSQNIPADVKWPNDISIEGLKLGGILCETVGDYVVTGIGLNLVEGSLPDGAVSVARWAPGVDPIAWAEQLVMALVPWFARSARETEEAWLKLWHGRKAIFDCASEELEGRLVELDLAADRARIVSNSQARWVMASQLHERWAP